MNSSVYEPPKSELVSPTQTEIPDEILKKIRNGWVAAIFSGVMTLALIFLLMGDTDVMGNLFDIWTSIDVVLIFLLALGIYKKSRTAATLMFVYFLTSKIWLFIETGKSIGIMAILFFYFYLQAMIGTYQYHKAMKSSDKSPHRTTETVLD